MSVAVRKAVGGYIVTYTHLCTTTEEVAETFEDAVNIIADRVGARPFGQLFEVHWVDNELHKDPA